MLAIIVCFFRKAKHDLKKALSTMFFFCQHYTSTPIYKASDFRTIESI